VVELDVLWRGRAAYGSLARLMSPSLQIFESSRPPQPGHPVDQAVKKPARRRAAARKPTAHSEAPPACIGRAQATFARLSAGLVGAAGIAVEPLGRGPIETFGSLQVAHA
jgi:hypothetical protein